MTTRTRGRRGVFEAAAGHFADLVRSIADDRWDEPAAWAVDPPGTRFTSAGPPRSG